MLTAALPPAGPRFSALSWQELLFKAVPTAISDKIILDIKHKSVQYASNSRGNSYDKITY
jgi:hypothetical protein